MPKFKQSEVLVGVLVLVVIGLGGVILFDRRDQSTTRSGVDSNAGLIADRSSGSGKSMATVPSDWQTHRDSQYGFAFSYPEGVSVTPHMVGNGNLDGLFITDGRDVEFSLWVYKTDCSQKCFKQEVIDWWPKLRLDGQPITVNGIKGFQLSLDGNPDGYGPVIRNLYLLSDEGVVVYFEIRELPAIDTPLSSETQHIIDTFEFL
jgi:hypothetical protein